MAALPRGWLLIVVLALLGAVARTRAEAAPTVAIHGQPLALTVHRGATCVDLELLVDELVPLLDDTDIPPGVQIEVVGSDDDPRTVTTRVRSADGGLAERTFSPAPTFCPYLHQALALTLALALKATLDGSALENAAESSTLPPERPTVPRAPTVARTGPALSIALGPTLGVGVVSQLAFGGLLEFGARWTYASLRLDAHGMRALQTELVGGAGNYQVSFYAARAAGCGRLPFDRVALALEACLGALFGRAHVDQHGARGSDQTARSLWGLSPSLALERDVRGAFSLRVAASLITVYRQLRIAARDEQGNEVAADDLRRLGGLFSVSLGYHGLNRAGRR